MSEENTLNAPAQENPAEESFEQLLAESSSKFTRLRPGEKIKTKVVGLSDEFAYVNLGGKTEGVVNLSEFADETGQPKIAIGEEIEAYFASASGGTVRLTTLVHGYSPARLSALQDAFEAGLAVSGEVRREVKGGFDVSINGIRAFCPFSQIDLRGGREGGVFLGQTFSFKILEFAEDGKNIILSRRALLEAEKDQRVADLKARLKVGDEINGVVRSVQKFGAFVQIEGIVDALIPVSEMSWERIHDPKTVLRPGQEVRAKLIGLDWEKNRLTLSLKALKPDPWQTVVERYPVDSQVKGTVARLESFGAFINLEPGIDGLIHLSNLGEGRRINHPREVLEVGQFVEPFVLSVDAENHRISLSLSQKVKPESIPLPDVNEAITGVVEKIMPFGIFVRMPSGLTGLVPNAELGTPKGSDHSKMFPPGTEMQVLVLEVDKAHHRVRLSRKAMIQKKEEQEYKEYLVSSSASQDVSSGPAVGSLGALLKAKLDEKRSEVAKQE